MTSRRWVTSTVWNKTVSRETLGGDKWLINDQHLTTIRAGREAVRRETARQNMRLISWSERSSFWLCKADSCAISCSKEQIQCLTGRGLFGQFWARLSCSSFGRCSTVSFLASSARFRAAVRRPLGYEQIHSTIFYNAFRDDFNSAICNSISDITNFEHTKRYSDVNTSSVFARAIVIADTSGLLAL